MLQGICNPVTRWKRLPVDTTLSGSDGFSSVMSSGVPLLHGSLSSKAAIAVVAEGISPVSCRLVEKIRKWENVNLMDLLKDPATNHLVLVNGQLMALHTDQRPCSSKTITDIFTWLWAFSVFMAVLLSSETTKEEAAGLTAHCYLILQMSKDLQGAQCAQYDQDFVNWQQRKAYDNGGS